MLSRLLLSIALMLPNLAFAIQRTGNGGDPLRLIFSKAKMDAELIVSDVDPTADFSLPVVPGSRRERMVRVQAFLAEPFAGFASRRLALIDDIRSSVHQWTYEEVDQPTCAWTNREGEDINVIHLSIPFCRALLIDQGGGPNQAIRQLVHEASHHVGVIADADETFADDIALFIFEAWEQKRDRSRPFWEPLTALGTPDMRFLHSTVWTGSTPNNAATDRKLMVWGGCNYAMLPNHEDCAHNLDSGGILDLSDAGRGQGWKAFTPNEYMPSARRNHIAIWTGATTDSGAADSMLVFGGCRGQNDSDMTCSQTLRDGALYSLDRSEWSPISSLPEAMVPRVFGASGWTGKEFILWGGLSGFDSASVTPIAVGDGARLVFDDSPNGRWVPMSIVGAPRSRFQSAALTNGRKLFLFSGCLRQGLLRCRDYATDLAMYDADADSQGLPAWQVIAAPASFQGRTGHSITLADNRYLIVWGGVTAIGTAADGLIYDLVTRNWREIPALLPLGESGRSDHQAFWDAGHQRLVVWGGQYANRQFSQSTMALQFSADYSTFSWTKLNTELSPIGRKGATGVWTGEEFLIWGGFGDQFTFLDVGDVLRLP